MLCAKRIKNRQYNRPDVLSKELKYLFLTSKRFILAIKRLENK